MHEIVQKQGFRSALPTETHNYCAPVMPFCTETTNCCKKTIRQQQAILPVHNRVEKTGERCRGQGFCNLPTVVSQSHRFFPPSLSSNKGRANEASTGLSTICALPYNQQKISFIQLICV
jgi:hypothetical protein